MTSIKIVTTSILMSLTVSVIAQKKHPVSMQWETAALLPADSGKQLATGLAGPVTGLHHEVFFIGGGANFPEEMPWNGGKKKYYNKIYPYQISNNLLVPLKKSFTLPFTIAYAACCTTPNGILYAGGENENGITNKVWLIQWDSAAENLTCSSLPDLPVALTNAAATCIGYKVYVAGGETASAASAQFMVLDIKNSNEGWKELAPAPQPVSHTVLAAVEKNTNSIYLAGGRKKNANGISDLYAGLYVYDIAANSWQTKTSLPYALCAGTGLFSDAGHLLMFGGDKGTTFHMVEAFLAAIIKETDDIKKQSLILRKNKLQAAHPGFSRQVLQYNITTDTWKSIGAIPFATPVTTTAVKNKNIVYLPSGEIKAGIRSPNILSVTFLPKTK